MSIKSKVSVKNLKVTCNIQAAKDDLLNVMQKELEKSKKDIKIPGFRAGHVPDKIIMEKHGQQILQTAIDSIINDEIDRVVAEKGFALVSRPVFEDETKLDVQEPSDIDVNVSFYIAPEIGDIDLKKLSIELPCYTIKDEDVDAGLKNILNRDAKDVEIKEDNVVVEKGMKASIDFEGTQNGIPFDGGTAKDFSQEIGVGKFIKDFDEAILGMKKGEEKIFDSTFPKDYHAPNLAGQTVQFKVKVNKIFKKELPELNDEYAKKSGTMDVEDLKNKVRTGMQDQYDKAIKRGLRSKVFDLLSSTYDFEVPEILVEEKIKSLKDSKAESGDKDKTTDKEMTERAKKNIKIAYLFDHILKKNKIEASENEVLSFIVEQMYAQGMADFSRMDSILKNENFKNNMKDIVLEGKVLDFILENASVNKKHLSKKEIEKFIATQNNDDQEEDHHEHGPDCKH